MKNASLSLRVLAFLADLGLWSAIVMVVLCLPGMGLMHYLPLIADSQQGGPPLTLAEILTFLVLSVLFVGLLGLVCAGFDIYCFLFEHRYGATLGKGIFGLCVRDAATGGFPSRRQCVLREVTRPFEVGGVLPAMTAIALDPQRRRVGDRWARTVVCVTESRLATSSFPWSGVSPKAFCEAPALGLAPFWRRAAAFLGDLGIVCLLLSPIDLVVSLFHWAPVFAEAYRGSYAGLSSAPATTFLGWLIAPLYVLYAQGCRGRLAATVGERVFGIRRVIEGNGIRAAVMPWLLLPLTIVEGAIGASLRRPWRTFADRAAGIRFETLQR